MVFINIIKYFLHSLAMRTPMMLYSKVVDQIISHDHIKGRTILNEEGRCIGSYLASEIGKYYKLFQHQVYMGNIFFKQFKKQHDIKNIISILQVEDKRFFYKFGSVYSINNFKEPYGENHFISFKDSWLPLAYTMVTISHMLNQVVILSHSLNGVIERVQKTKSKLLVLHISYMSSQLMDVNYTTIFFTRVNLSRHISNLLLHVYYQLIKENTRHYTKNCDQFSPW